jgi:hypothetical protein
LTSGEHIQDLKQKINSFTEQGNILQKEIAAESFAMGLLKPH